MTAADPNPVPPRQGEPVATSEAPMESVADVPCYWCGNLLSERPVLALTPTPLSLDPARACGQSGNAAGRAAGGAAGP